VSGKYHHTKKLLKTNEKTLYTEVLQQIGLSKNEAKIYETLLTHGELSVGNISIKSKIHRRNIYDTIQRLLQKGLVFEIIESKENKYQAVEPNKVMEMLKEKENLLSSIMPNLENLYKKTPHQNKMFVYKGIEGWKNYFKDILNVKEDFYCIGGKGGWLDPQIQDIFPEFIKEAQKEKITMWHIFDPEVKIKCPEITKYVGKNYKFFPDKYVSFASADIFGDYVCLPTLKAGSITDEFSLSVIVNPQIADSFRTWFRFMYEFCEK